MKKLLNGATLACMVGMIVSIVVFVGGISTYNSADEFFVSSNMKFGGDFYTEIFEEVEQIKASTRGIENAIYEVGGLLLMSFGAMGFCYFGKPVLEVFVSKKEDRDEKTADGALSEDHTETEAEEAVL